jgi:hypothetical protein
MSKLARLAAALASAVAPAVSLAQEAGGRDTVARPHAGYGWLWLLVAALVVVALFRVLVVRNRRAPPSPPARHP